MRDWCGYSKGNSHGIRERETLHPFRVNFSKGYIILMSRKKEAMGDLRKRLIQVKPGRLWLECGPVHGKLNRKQVIFSL